MLQEKSSNYFGYPFSKNAKVIFLVFMIMSSSIGNCGGVKVFEEGLPASPDVSPFENRLPIREGPVRMVIGSGFVVAVKNDGTVWSWGTSVHGELGTGLNDTSHYEPKRLKGLDQVVEVAAGFHHVVALKKDGTVWGWGDNSNMQLGSAKKKNIFAPEKISVDGRISRVAATASGSVFLRDDGRILFVGKNKDKRLFEAPEEIAKPLIVATIKDAKTISTSASSISILSNDGRIFAFGPNYLKRHGIDVSHLEVSDIFSTSYLAIILDSSGFLYAGTTIDAEILGERAGGISKEDFRRVAGVGRIIRFSFHGGLVMALDEQGRIWQWGTNVKAHPDPGGAGVSRVYKPTVFFELDGVEEIFTGPLTNAAFTKDGGVYFWGSGGGGVRTRRISEESYSEKKVWMTPEKINWTWK